jgi:hypothetical protein
MKPPGELGGAPGDQVAEVVEELRALGIAVDLRARMHQKIAILDGRVLWHGSLNILSHRDADESMLRIEGAAACEAVGRNLSTPTGRKDDRADLHAAENPGVPRTQYSIARSCTTCSYRAQEQAARPARPGP